MVFTAIFIVTDYKVNKLRRLDYILIFFRFDYLRIFNDRNQIIGTYCGLRTGHSVRVSGTSTLIKFHSDGSVQYKGYDLSFSYASPGKYRADVSVEL